MSNRTEAQISAQAELRLSHLAQIEALTKPGLTDLERVEKFADAASFEARFHSPAVAVWLLGHPQKSLFAHLPGCQCPVLERLVDIDARIQAAINKLVAN